LEIDMAMKYYLLWEGPSALDGQPIAVVAGEGSSNRKTGPMLQVYIIRNDMHPQDAVSTDQDVSICGDCKFRGKKGKGRTCYVTLMHGTYQVWEAKDAWIPIKNLRKFGRHRKIRVGAYGDPAMAPYEMWAELLSASDGHTGYTHQWRTCDQRFSQIIQASCDHLGDYHEAKAAGWYTYRVKLPDESRQRGERPCPASNESDTDVTCSDCLGCNGTRRDFTINAHGPVGAVKKYREFRMTLEATPS
jgi:hypothetical protein